MTSARVHRAAAARRLLELRTAAASFPAFVRFLQPDWTLAPFQEELIEALDALERSELDQDCLLVTMPPRMAKSTFSSIFFPAYFMARDPSRYCMAVSYNDKLATDFGRQVRNLVTDPRMSQLFPGFGPSKDSRAVDQWRTEQNGAYFAIGIGGTTSGRPANALIIDDPIKSRDDAESLTQRNKTWNYYSSALTTRLQPDSQGNRPKQLVVLTRWHPDDMAGRLMKSEDWKEGRWKHINYQAILDRTISRTAVNKLPADHPFYNPKPLRELTESERYHTETEEVSLWPERFPLEELKRRRRLNPREFASLYQQQPYIQGGNLLRTEWWRYYPADLKPERFAALVITIDTAFKRNEQADYSVAIVAGIDANGDIYIVDLMRGRYEFPELKQRAVLLNNFWRGKGLRAIYVEDKASGQTLIQELKRQSGLSIIPYKVVHDKVARVNAILPIIEGGRVFLPDDAPWLDTFMEEATAFPGGAHDDQVDAFTMAIDILSRTSVGMDAMALMHNLDLSLNAIDHRNLGASLSTTMAKQARNAEWKGWGL